MSASQARSHNDLKITDRQAIVKPFSHMVKPTAAETAGAVKVEIKKLRQLRLGG